MSRLSIQMKIIRRVIRALFWWTWRIQTMQNRRWLVHTKKYFGHAGKDPLYKSTDIIIKFTRSHMRKLFSIIFLVFTFYLLGFYAYGMKPTQVCDPNSLSRILYSCMVNYRVNSSCVFTYIFYPLWSWLYNFYFRRRSRLRDISFVIHHIKCAKCAEWTSGHRRLKQKDWSTSQNATVFDPPIVTSAINFMT